MAKRGIIFKINQAATKMLQTRVNQLAGRYSSKAREVNQLFAEKFCECARARLRRGIAEGENNLDFIEQYISVQPVRGGYAVVVDNSSAREKNIMAFLEYGTGLMGKNTPHPVAKLIGWEYAINEAEYIDFGNAGVGWLFRDRGYNYINTTDGDTCFGKEVFSQGITPIRYIYDTQRQFKNILNLSFAPAKNGKRVFSLKSLETRLRNVRV